MKIWSTPQDVFDKLDDEFHFDIDVCADDNNAKCQMYYSRQRGLIEDWGGVCFLNPPYGKEISQWLKKALEVAANRDDTVVCLLPVRSNPPWWHNYVMKATEIRFVRKKLSFTGGMGVPFWGNAIVVFRKGSVGQSPAVSSWDQPRHIKENNA